MPSARDRSELARPSLVSASGLASVTRSLGRLLPYVVVVGCGLVFTYMVARDGSLMYDFRGGLYNAGVDILHGRHFYQPAFLARQAAILHAGGIAKGELTTNTFSLPVYPAFANVLVVPLALLPFWAASLVYTCLSVAAMAIGLRLLGVRDWRCVALALLSWPFQFGALLGAVGPFLVLGTGVAWRFRDRIWPPAIAIAAIVAAKVFPWPLGVWLLITRRWKAAAACVVAGLVITFGAWAIIGFQGMAQYPQMLSNMSFIQEDRAVSVVAALLILGVPSTIATAVAMLAAIGILVLAWRLAQRPGGDRRAFGLVIVTALTATPIVWEHYMVLLFVPVALTSPRLSRLWLVPLMSPLIDVFLPMTSVMGARNARPYSKTTLEEALVWIALETVVAVALCTTAEQRSAFAARIRARVQSRLRPAAAQSVPISAGVPELSPQD